VDKLNLKSNPFQRKQNSEAPIMNVYYGEVVSIDDPTGAMRIKVRISGIDDEILDKDLPYCSAFLPKFFYILPQEKEAVRVLLGDRTKPYNLRFWIGNIVSQPQNYNFDPYYFTALNTTEFQMTTPLESIDTFPDATGIYPTSKDIAIVGRDNTDIILSEKNLKIRAGKHEVDDNLKLNKTNPSYVELNIDEDGSKSTANILADYINIISHKGRPKFKSILDSDEIENIIEQAQPLAKGNTLVEVLELIIQAIVTHVHGYNGLPADNGRTILKLKDLDVKQILSEYIRIN
jgi:hypothetical protein